MSLTEMNVGQHGTVLSNDDSVAKQFGFFAGSTVQLIDKTLFGGSYSVKIGNKYIAIHKNEADLIKVSVCNCSGTCLK